MSSNSLIFTVNTSPGTGAVGRELRQLRMQYLQVEQRVNWISAASLTLTVDDNPLQKPSTSSEMTLCQPGNEMTIKIGGDVLFTGLITNSYLTQSFGIRELTLTLKHELIKLENVIHSRIFINQTDADIIRGLCSPGRVSISDGAKGRLSIKHEQRIQLRCTDWQMLRLKLDACGVWLITDPTEARIISPVLEPVPTHCLDANDSVLPVEKAEWYFSGMDKPASLSVACWDIKTQKRIEVLARQPKLGEGAFDPGAAKPFNDKPWVLGYGTSVSPEVLHQQADSVLQNLLIRRAQGVFTVRGTKLYKLGQTLKVSGFGNEFDGSGIITAIVQVITPSEWNTTVTIGEDSGLGITRLSQSQGSVLLPGVVVGYDENDPRDFCRILIHLYTLDEDHTKNQVWARFAMPYASKKQSFLCYPAPGDEVVVGFFDDSPDDPVIIGAMHNPQKPPAMKPGKDNSLKGWDLGDMKMQLDTNKKTVVIGASTSSVITIEEDKVTVKGSKIDLTN